MDNAFSNVPATKTANPGKGSAQYGKRNRLFPMTSSHPLALVKIEIQTVLVHRHMGELLGRLFWVRLP
jgi:hypothetical protein